MKKELYTQKQKIHNEVKSNLPRSINPENSLRGIQEASTKNNEKTNDDFSGIFFPPNACLSPAQRMLITGELMKFALIMQDFGRHGAYIDRHAPVPDGSLTNASAEFIAYLSCGEVVALDRHDCSALCPMYICKPDHSEEPVAHMKASSICTKECFFVGDYTGETSIDDLIVMHNDRINIAAMNYGSGSDCSGLEILGYYVFDTIYSRIFNAVEEELSTEELESRFAAEKELEKIGFSYEQLKTVEYNDLMNLLYRYADQIARIDGMNDAEAVCKVVSRVFPNKEDAQ